MLHGARQSHSVLLSYRLREGWELMTTAEGVLRELLAEAMPEVAEHLARFYHPPGTDS